MADMDLQDSDVKMVTNLTEIFMFCYASFLDFGAWCLGQMVGKPENGQSSLDCMGCPISNPAKNIPRRLLHFVLA